MNKVCCGNRLKMLRNERELSIEMLVLDINSRYLADSDKPLNQSMVSRWENNINDPSLRQVALLAQYYNVSVDFIIGLTDKRAPMRLIHKG